MTDEVKNRGGFDWLATVFYPLAVVLMEVFWVYPWLVWLGSWPMYAETRPVLNLASVIITLALSLLVTRLALKQEWSLSRIRLVIIGGGLVVILFVLGADYNAGYGFLSAGWFAHTGQALGTTFSHPHTIVLAIPALLYLWWRGITLGQTTSNFRDVYRSFLLGMVALIFLIIFWQISASSGRFTGPGTEIGWYVMAFFFFGLIAIALYHLYVMRGSMPKEEARLTSVWRWVPIMLGVIGGMVLIGFGIASIFSPDLYASIGHGFSDIGGFLGKILSYILIPIVFVFEWLMRIFMYLINLLRSNQALTANSTANQSGQLWPETVVKQLPTWATETIKWFVVALIIGLVLFILMKAVSRIRDRRLRNEIEEIHESLWSWKGLRDDMKELLKSLFKRKEGPVKVYHFDENVKDEMDVREIYRQLQWEGGRSGIPRRRHETASEYTSHLGRELPDSHAPLDDITRMYENVRYGENTIPPEHVRKANGLWLTIKGMLRKLRGD